MKLDEQEKMRVRKISIDIPEGQELDGNRMKEIDQQQIGEPTVVKKDKWDPKFKIPDVYRFPFDKPGMEKPWERDQSKMEDYFNYGMYSSSPHDYSTIVLYMLIRLTKSTITLLFQF